MPQMHECGHIVTTYILPDIFHCVAFIIGLVYFRITEGESVYSLMEKVNNDFRSFQIDLLYVRSLSMLSKMFVYRVPIELFDD